MRVLVCGGRDFNDKELLYSTLDRVLSKYPDELCIVHGSCQSGADKMAEDWCKLREVDYMGFPAKWKKHGRSGGPKRNKRMRDQSSPDACIAFKGGDGTLGMVALMKEAGIEPWMVGWA